MKKTTSLTRGQIAGRITVKVILYACVVVIAIMMLLPFFWSLVSSLRPEIENLMGFSLYPKRGRLNIINPFLQECLMSVPAFRFFR